MLGDPEIESEEQVVQHLAAKQVPVEPKPRGQGSERPDQTQKCLSRRKQDTRQNEASKRPTTNLGLLQKALRKLDCLIAAASKGRTV